MDKKEPSAATETVSRATGRNYLAVFLLFVFCMATWVVLSGKFDLFHLLLGVLSSAIVAVLSSDILLPELHLKKLPGQWWRFIAYIPWLLYQVFLANIHVMYLVFHPRMNDLINPRTINFRSQLKSEMALFILANSITLTPGTITVYVSILGDFTVHIIDDQSGQAMPGEMEERIARVMNARVMNDG